MQSINKYINEKLTLNKQSKSSNIEIDIIEPCMFTEDEITRIITYFENQKIIPYKISNIDHESEYEYYIFIFYKSPYYDDTVIEISKKRNTVNSLFNIVIYWYDKDANMKSYSYPYNKQYVSLDKIINKWLPEAIENEDFINSLEK